MYAFIRCDPAGGSRVSNLSRVPFKFFHTKALPKQEIKIRLTLTQPRASRKTVGLEDPALAMILRYVQILFYLLLNEIFAPIVLSFVQDSISSYLYNIVQCCARGGRDMYTGYMYRTWCTWQICTVCTSTYVCTLLLERQQREEDRGGSHSIVQQSYLIYCTYVLKLLLKWDPPAAERRQRAFAPK